MIAHGTSGHKPLNVVVGEGQSKASFEVPRWDEDDPVRHEIDTRIPENHLVRQIDMAVDQLDLRALFASYRGHGSKALRPDLLLKAALYGIVCGKPSPSTLFRELRESEPVEWLARGIQPSRIACYEFWNRVGPLLDGWIRHVLHTAREE